MAALERTSGRALIAALLGVLLVATLLRAPFISSGLPYFSNEDEAHHFNRLVRMAQTSDWNPHYFHKPSLHFYLRLPALWVSAFVAEWRGHLDTLRDVRTSDSFGLSGYSFTASHPGLVKWNRAFSVALSLGIVLLTFSIAQVLFQKSVTNLLAPLLVALSPELVRSSATIGVDVVMGFFVLLTVLLALTAHLRRSVRLLWATAVCAGLAVSSKYNAAPIALCPLAVALQFNRRTLCCGVALGLMALGFLLGSPYILFEFYRFIEQLQYEAWHYGVAGHSGNEGMPGIPQALFYLHWFASEDLGLPTLLCGGVGLLCVTRSKPTPALLVFGFPLLFFLLMIMQKVNFTRNMLVCIPFVALAVTAAFHQVLSPTHQRFLFARRVAAVCLLLVVVIPALNSSLLRAQEAFTATDSRHYLSAWLETKARGDFETAISGQLQLPRYLSTAPRMRTVDEETTTWEELFQNGIDRWVRRALATEKRSTPIPVKVEFAVAGVAAPQRVVVSPGIVVEQRTGSSDDIFALISAGALSLNERRIELTPESVRPHSYQWQDPRSAQDSGEDYCWLTERFTRIELVPAPTLPAASHYNVSLELLSPWDKQRVFILQGETWQMVPLTSHAPGEWQQVTLALRDPPSELSFYVERIHSPRDMKIGADTRKLGVAVRSLAIIEH